MARSSGMRREALHLEGPTFGYAATMELAKKISIIVPFITWPIMAIAAFVLHEFWPDNMWAMAFISAATVFFAWFIWYLTRDRKGLASEHFAICALIYGAILCEIDHAGWTRVTAFLIIFGVGLVCCTWAARNAIRHHDETSDGNINKLFETAGLAPGTKMHLKPGENEVVTTRASQGRRLAFWRPKAIQGTVIDDTPKDGKQRTDPIGKKRTGKIILKPGETVETLAKRVGSIESAGNMPPGTMLVTADADNARRADVVISDPRAIKNSLPYPGPSYINGSIADTISTGMYQDGTEVEWDILGLQIQIMGMVGSGKSLGAGWSALAEIVSRHDAIVWGIDITKGDQTLGPLRPALHRLDTTPAMAVKTLQDANRLIKPRTDYLAKKGLGKWAKGCGLKYLVVWIEEVPDVMEEIGDDGEAIWIKSVKAARSAGISFVWSLQRADYSQIPTITRGQAAKWCFGVADSHEGSFGLSSVQDAAGCEPELWANRHPGKFYLDAPSIASNYVPMPARAWYWGADDSLISAHALNFPVSEREPDEVMLAVLGSPTPSVPSTAQRTRPISQPNKWPEIDTVPSFAKPVDDDSDGREVEDLERITDADLDTELEELVNDVPLDDGSEAVDPLPPDAARAVMRNWLVARAGQTVKTVDLIEARKRTGYGRAWGYKVMAEFEAEYLVKRIDDQGSVSWVVTDDPSLLSREE